MKKIFSILLLFACSFAHSQIGQFSPIWTYTGSNIQYTNGATLTSSLGVGALPTSSLSSFRVVKGTSTIDLGAPGSSLSAIWLNASNPSGSNYSLYEDASNTFLNAKSGQSIFLSVNASNIARVTSSGLISLGTFSATGASTITGALTAQSTMSLGSANLTGGNTGTVAVLSDAIFSQNYMIVSGNPSDNSTNFATIVPFGWTTINVKGKIPNNCEAYFWQCEMWVNGTTASAESVTIALQVNTTTITLNSTASMSVSGPNTYSGSISQSISANDAINGIIYCPNFGTNPTSVGVSLNVWYRRKT